MLTLTIKRKWFDMILSKEKSDEYRDIKSYYTSRLLKYFNAKVVTTDSGVYIECDGKSRPILFRNGYSSRSRSFIANCTLSVGTGKPIWGAIDSVKLYYKLHIEDIDESSIKV